MKFYFVFFWVIVLFNVKSQDLSGRWIAVTDEFSTYYGELYLINNHENNYAGHSYDTEKGGYCRHFLDAKFFIKSQQFIGSDVELIQKSETHDATDYILKYEKDEDGKEYLIGTIQVFTLSLRNKKLDFNELKKGHVFYPGSQPMPIKFIKVSDEYKPYDASMPLAMNDFEVELRKAEFPEAIEKIEPIYLENQIYNTPETFEPITSDAVVSKQKIDSILKPLKIDSNIDLKRKEIIRKRKKRYDVVVSHIKLKTNNVILLVRDYGTEDNDSISIFYNDKIIVQGLRLDNKASEFELNLLPNQRNELVFVADNLGDVPPNTARVTIIADNRRFNYRLFTDNEKNALILLEDLTK